MEAVAVGLLIGFTLQYRWAKEAAALNYPRPPIKTWMYRMGLGAAVMLAIASIDATGANGIFPVYIPDVLIKVASSVEFLTFAVWLYFTVAILFKQVRREPPTATLCLLISAVGGGVLTFIAAVTENATDRSYWWTVISLIPTGIIFFAQMVIAGVVYCMLRRLLVDFMNTQRKNTAATQSHADSAAKDSKNSGPPTPKNERNVSRAGPHTVTVNPSKNKNSSKSPVPTVPPVSVASSAVTAAPSAEAPVTTVATNTEAKTGEFAPSPSPRRVPTAVSAAAAASSSPPPVPPRITLPERPSFGASLDAPSPPPPIEAPTPKSRTTPAIGHYKYVDRSERPTATGATAATATSTKPPPSATATTATATAGPGGLVGGAAGTSGVVRTTSGTQVGMARTISLGPRGGASGAGGTSGAGEGMTSKNAERTKHIEQGLRTLSWFMCLATFVFVAASILGVSVIEQAFADPNQPAYHTPSSYDASRSESVWPTYLAVALMFWYSYESRLKVTIRAPTLTTVQINRGGTFSKQANNTGTGTGTRVGGRPGDAPGATSILKPERSTQKSRQTRPGRMTGGGINGTPLLKPNTANGTSDLPGAIPTLNSTAEGAAGGDTGTARNRTLTVDGGGGAKRTATMNSANDGGNLSRQATMNSTTEAPYDASAAVSRANTLGVGADGAAFTNFGEPPFKLGTATVQPSAADSGTASARARKSGGWAAPVIVTAVRVATSSTNDFPATPNGTAAIAASGATMSAGGVSTVDGFGSPTNAGTVQNADGTSRGAPAPIPLPSVSASTETGSGSGRRPKRPSVILMPLRVQPGGGAGAGGAGAGVATPVIQVSPASITVVSTPSSGDSAYLTRNPISAPSAPAPALPTQISPRTPQSPPVPTDVLIPITNSP